MGDQVTASSSDGGMSLGHMMLIAGVNQIEAQDDIFVAQRELSREMGLTMLSDAATARSKKFDAAMKTAIAEGIDAGTSAASALSNGVGALRSEKIDVQKQGSDDFKTQFNSKQQKVTDLEKTETVLSERTVDPSLVDADGNAPQNLDADGRTMAELSEQEVQGWKNERKDLQLDLDNNPNMPQSEQAPIRKKIGELNEKIDGYEANANQRAAAPAVDEDSRAVTDVDSESAADPNDTGMTYSQLEESDVQKWRDERSELQGRLNNEQNLSEGAQEDIRGRIKKLDKAIGTYDELQQTKSDIKTTKHDVEQLVNTEQRRISDQIRMQTDCYTQLAVAAGRGLSAAFKFDGEANRIEGEEYDTLSRWHGDRASAFEQYASQSMSTINGLSEQVMHAQETEQSAIRRMTQV